MKKIISFSLYGTEPKYLIGALCNAELANILFPRWICRFYCGTSVPEETINKLKKYENCEVIIMEENNKFSYMMWRFIPIDESDVEVMIVRDCDSRLSNREKRLVEIFLDSDKLFHSIRDEGNHTDVMGGMWGMKKNSRLEKMIDLVENWKGGLGYNSDQLFIRQILVPKFNDSIMIHCSTYLKNFPEDLKQSYPHIGMVFPADNYGKPYNYIHY
jgi:hypothetical protein